MFFGQLHNEAKGVCGAKFRRFACLIAMSALSALPAQHAYAQDAKDSQASTGNFKLDVTPSFSNENEIAGPGVNINLPAEGLGSQIFDLDTSDIGCLTGESTCLKRDENLDMRYSKSLTASIDKIIDIEVTPRASMRFDDGTSSALFGALVRIGDDLKVGEELKSNTWYMFAGADAEAVSYSPNNLDRVAIGDFNLQDRILVGDAQAGVGYRLGQSTDISLGYFRREVTSLGNDTNTDGKRYSEDAAALSFTWRR